MDRWSSPIEAIEERYDVVVIGSGYGGAITASRIARTGRSVCLLERGKELHPGEYPDQLLELAAEFQTTSSFGHAGSRTGLYDLHWHKDMSVFVGCGLGGTSLVNANVAIEAEGRVFDDPAWPAALSGGTALDPYYGMAMRMLGANPLPAEYDPAKLAALEVSSKELGGRFYRPHINVTFADRVNEAGVAQRACTQCGDCVSGCNFSAKNTVLMNYLPDAFNHGAHIFTQVPVRWVERTDGGWLVHYQILDSGREPFDAPDQFVAAGVVVLAAGTLGSTEILLRSQAHGLAASSQLGKHFTGNGDVLGFSYDTNREINTIGWGHRRGASLPKVGPCITGIIDLREQPELTDGMVIEEGSIPGALHTVIPDALGLAAETLGQDTGGLLHRIGDKLKDLVDHREAAGRTQTYLVMAHDEGNGTMALDEHDQIEVSWPGVAEQNVFGRIKTALERATAPLHGQYVEDPIAARELDSLITVHPLGGCVMADDAEHGVVNDRGQVFSGTTGDAVYPDLYVSDGSVIPVPLGVNPLLTISAVTERTCALLAADRGWTIDPSPTSTPPPGTPPDTGAVGIRFTERMSGYFSALATQGGVAHAQYEASAAAGQAAGSSFAFILTIASEDVDRLIADPTHPAEMVGTVQAPTLSPTALEVSEGHFNLFMADPATPGNLQMHYAMRITSEAGRSYFFKGFKEMVQGETLEVWPQTSTLYVTLFDGPDDQSPAFARGVLRIAPSDFAKQLRTMGAVNAPSKEAALKATARFGILFAGGLFRTYGHITGVEHFFDPDAPPRRTRPLAAPAPEVHTIASSDGVPLRLTRYPSSGRPVLLTHSIGQASTVFSTDMVSPNLVETLCGKGFDLWLLDHRGSIELASAALPFTGDDLATKDLPAALSAVRAATGAAAVPVVGEGFGAMAALMAVLSGAEGVDSLVCCQAGAHVRVPLDDRIRAGLHLPGALAHLGVKPFAGGGWRQHLQDAVLGIAGDDDSCPSPACRRIRFVYSLPYEHANLDPGVHGAIGELYGPTSIEALQHLAAMVRAGHVVDATGADSYLPHLDRLALPITFIHGSQNTVFLPASSEATYDVLVTTHGQAGYARHVIEGYGDVDCLIGRRAAGDVYPLIIAHLEQE
ncbi:MAG TPA: GMC family oxidoreductase N-terminal domain-containing protein [Actinomycetota bacterium]|nr:GMC family oxidoreductase N-terminal domain-containing protein [Actinomycetota bacterium]